MTVIISSPSNSLSSFDLLTRRGSDHDRINNSSRGELGTSALKRGCIYLGYQKLQLAKTRSKARSVKAHGIMESLSRITSSSPPPPNSPIWATCVLGSIISVVLALFKLRGGFLRYIGNKVEEVAEAVEDVAEIVEDVAEAVEKVSSAVADSLPQKEVLKDVASWVEQASKEVAEDARETIDFIHKVDEITDEIEKDWEASNDSNEDKQVLEKEKQGAEQNEEKETLVRNENEGKIKEEKEAKIGVENKENVSTDQGKKGVEEAAIGRS